jgi:hypothetical protein
VIDEIWIADRGDTETDTTLGQTRSGRELASRVGLAGSARESSP